MAECRGDGRERKAAEEIWLMYFNNCLFENGVITEEEYNRMAVRIVGRSADKTKKDRTFQNSRSNMGHEYDRIPKI